MAEFLRDMEVQKYDLIAIQEPWHNPFTDTTHHPNKQRFHLIWPAGNARARVCWYVSKEIDIATITSTVFSRDLMSIHIRTPEGTITFHNIYNPCVDGYLQPEELPANSTLPQLSRALEKCKEHEQVVVGDFNIHHPKWGGIRCQPSTGRGAEYLCQLMGAYGMQLCLEPGTVTRQRDQQNQRDSTIDLVIATALTANRIIRCEVRKELHKSSDHLPISTIIATDWTHQAPVTRRLFKQTNTEQFTNSLRLRLLGFPEKITTREEIETGARVVTQALAEAVNRSTPEAKQISKLSKPNWTPECTEAIREEKRARRRARRSDSEEDWEEFRRATNRKKKLISAATRQTHRDKMEEVTDVSSLWKLARWVRRRELPATPFTPPIRDVAGELQETLEGKTRALRKVLFPQPRAADLTDLEDYIYPTPCDMPPITEWEVSEAIRSSKADNAPGPDQLPNRVLKLGSQLLIPVLTRLFQASIDLQYWPDQFKQATVVVLRKEAKPDYQDPKAYRPVALLNTLSKVMEFVLARRIAYQAETYNLLPRTHCGGRKASSTEHAIHLIMEKVHAAWKEDKVASMLLLDVSGAYDNVSHPRLLHNLRKRKLHPQLVGWIRSYLTKRTARLKLNEGYSEQFETTNGIPQGSPISPILYLFYAADLLEIGGNHQVKVGYVDDTAFLTTGQNTEETTEQLKLLFGEAVRLSATHSSEFSPAKSKLIHFYKNGNNDPGDLERAITLETGGQTTTINPVQSARYLGVILDSKLNGDEHLEHAKASATKQVGALAALGGSSWGISLIDLRRLYQATVAPKMLYAASCWYSPLQAWGTGAQRKKIIQTLTQIQYQATKTITGAFGRNSALALDIELDIMPMDERLCKTTLNTALRLITSPVYKTIKEIRRPARPARQTTLNRYGIPREAKKFSLSERLEIALRRILGNHHNTDAMETQVAVPVAPWWIPPVTNIAENWEESIKQHNQMVEAANTADWFVAYTDGSEMDGHVGAGAFIPKLNSREKTYLGPATVQTVYCAELIGISLALQKILDWRRQHTEAGPSTLVIFTDNQAAILSIIRPGNQSGQQVIRMIVQLISWLRELTVQVQIHWVKSHADVEGNEIADRLAKEATGWRESGNRRPPVGQPIMEGFDLRSACKRTIHQKLRKEVERKWHTTTCGRQLYKIHKTPTSKALELHLGLPRAISSIVTQLRTGKAGLRDFLHRIGAVESPNCDCGSLQTAKHVIQICPTWRDLRGTYWPEPEGQPLSFDDILTDAKQVATAARFMLATGTLHQFSKVKSKHQHPHNPVSSQS